MAIVGEISLASPSPPPPVAKRSVLTSYEIVPIIGISGSHFLKIILPLSSMIDCRGFASTPGYSGKAAGTTPHTALLAKNQSEHTFPEGSQLCAGGHRRHLLHLPRQDGWTSLPDPHGAAPWRRGGRDLPHLLAVEPPRPAFDCMRPQVPCCLSGRLEAVHIRGRVPYLPCTYRPIIETMWLLL